MTRVSQPNTSIGDQGNIEASTSGLKDVFDSPNVVDASRVTRSTRGLAGDVGVHEHSTRRHPGKEQHTRPREQTSNLISAWRTSRENEEYQSPVERAKARLASWYVT